MFHKELSKQIEQLTKRIDRFESRMQKLREAAYFLYYDSEWFFRSYREEISASDAIEKILDHLHLTFECESAKERECHLVSTIPTKKPKKKPKKKAKKKK